MAIKWHDRKYLKLHTYSVMDLIWSFLLAFLCHFHKVILIQKHIHINIWHTFSERFSVFCSKGKLLFVFYLLCGIFVGKGRRWTKIGVAAILSVILKLLNYISTCVHIYS